jgi:hypothetical protein
MALRIRLYIESDRQTSIRSRAQGFSHSGTHMQGRTAANGVPHGRLATRPLHDCVQSVRLPVLRFRQKVWHGPWTVPQFLCSASAAVGSQARTVQRPQHTEDVISNSMELTFTYWSMVTPSPLLPVPA